MGTLTGENANGVVTAGSDAAALAQSASMDRQHAEDTSVHGCPGQVRDSAAESTSWQLTTWLCILDSTECKAAGILKADVTLAWE